YPPERRAPPRARAVDGAARRAAGDPPPVSDQLLGHGRGPGADGQRLRPDRRRGGEGLRQHAGEVRRRLPDHGAATGPQPAGPRRPPAATPAPRRRAGRRAAATSPRGGTRRSGTLVATTATR